MFAAHQEATSPVPLLPLRRLGNANQMLLRSARAPVATPFEQILKPTRTGRLVSSVRQVRATTLAVVRLGGVVVVGAALAPIAALTWLAVAIEQRRSRRETAHPVDVVGQSWIAEMEIFDRF